MKEIKVERRNPATSRRRMESHRKVSLLRINQTNRCRQRVTHEPQAITKPGGDQCMARELEN